MSSTEITDDGQVLAVEQVGPHVVRTHLTWGLHTLATYDDGELTVEYRTWGGDPSDDDRPCTLIVDDAEPVTLDGPGVYDLTFDAPGTYRLRIDAERAQATELEVTFP